MKKSFEGDTQRITAKVEEWLSDKKGQFDYYQVVIEILED